jgi:Xaa-Pro aminopeptidase
MGEHKKRLDNLRKVLKDQGLDGFIIPRADRYFSKYPADHDERLRFLSGFTGSAGNIALTQKKAIVMTDARYAITIKNEVDSTAFETDSTSSVTTANWLKENAAKKSKIGFDPMLHSESEINTLKNELDAKGIELVAVKKNPVDAMWDKQPAKPNAKAFIHDEQYAGKSSKDKRDEIAEELKAKAIDHFVMSATDEICWMLNIRGRDTQHSPTVQCSAIFNAANSSVDLYINKDKIDADVKKHLGKDVKLHDEKNYQKDIKALAKSGKTIGYQPSKTPFGIAKILNKKSVNAAKTDSPAHHIKAVKNKVEQENLRLAHLRDSLAWVKFLCWMDAKMPYKGVKEMDLSNILDGFRKQDKMFDGHGYGPIAGWAENGANIHYHAQGDGAEVGTDNLFLLDSGAQSLDGQTDFTRAILIGKPSAEMIERYTLVLKGHISLAKATFPKGTTGTQLDTLARKALWEKGLNYPHGTGHGVGFYMDVHEGPFNISPRSNTPLKEGALLSNEPGYYKEGHYGIRLENEVLVQKSPVKGEQEMLHFETISFVPFDRRLIDTNLLSADELGWLNKYHSDVYHKLADKLDDVQKKWLKEATAPLPPAHRPSFKKAAPK